MKFQSTLSSAQAFAKSGRLEEWVHAYLNSDANNPAFSEGLKLFERIYIGPLRMPLSLFSRCCGPEENMTWKVDPQGFERKVQRLMHVIATEKDLPPLIVYYENKRFELNDGNHRYEAYHRLGTQNVDCIVWITHRNDYAQFIDDYAEDLISR